jgi:hypothetical protein
VCYARPANPPVESKKNERCLKMTRDITNCDMFRASNGADEVGVCYTTLMEYEGMGLEPYRVGKAVYFSRSELAMFIKIISRIKRRFDLVPRQNTTTEKES